MKPLFALVILCGCSACPIDKPVPPPANPPQVFLTLTETNVIGDAVKGQVTVSGCKTVTQVAIYQQDQFLFDTNFTKSPTTFTLPAGLFAQYYPQVGIAASLTLKAKVTCDDGRTNNSTPAGVKFFPIAGRFVGPAGEQLVPDNFTAEGGLGGAANTFLGCVRTQTGTTIARVNTAGELLAFVGAMPFDCSLSTTISDLSLTSGYRWVFEPNVGAFALCLSAACNDFSVGKVLRNNRTARIGVGKSGIAVVWVNELSTTNAIYKLNPGATDTSNDWLYQFGFAVILNSDPMIDDGAGNAVWISRWEFDMGTKIANTVPYRFNLANGMLTNGVINGVPTVLLQQQYPVNEASMPIMPEGFFSPTGDTFTLPVLSFNTDGTLQTTVISCTTSIGLCEGAARRWTSPTFPGMVRLALPYSAGNIYAVIGPYQVYFLNAQLGTVLNLGMNPIRPSGSLQVLGVQAGGGADFYVLTGPDFGGAPTFPTEIIAVDTPQSGELWRVEFGSGESPNNALTISIDAANAVWLRTGAELIKPLPNNEYRMARGPTPIP